MTVFIQDTARNTLPKWACEAVSAGFALGAYLSPFTSPLVGNGYKRSAADTSEAIRGGGGEFWFDPMTHALDMPRTGDFRYYDSWPLWPSGRGDLTTPALVSEHIEAVFGVQNELQAPHLGPTVLVSYPDSDKSQAALEMSAAAVSVDPDCWLTIAGDSQFWSSGAELDAHVGALDQLEPAGWLLTVGRADNAVPPGATALEVFGLMRTTYALSREKPVRVAFGDLAGLPAVAAGAEAVGTGWDVRQRICAYQDFEEREGDKSGGAWYQRPSLEGLLGGLANPEYEVLRSEDPARARRLAPGEIGPRPQDAFTHHARILSRVTDDLNTLAGADRVQRLLSRYESAADEWPPVQRITRTNLTASRWITPFADGLRLFQASEGWV